MQPGVICATRVDSVLEPVSKNESENDSGLVQGSEIDCRLGYIFSDGFWGDILELGLGVTMVSG